MLVFDPQDDRTIHQVFVKLLHQMVLRYELEDTWTDDNNCHTE